VHRSHHASQSCVFIVDKAAHYISVCNQPPIGQLSLSSLASGVNPVSSFLAGVKRGAFTCVEWQVTSRSSEVCIHEEPYRITF